MSFFKRLRSFLRREKLDAELDDELQFHLDQRTQDFIDEGMTPREARYASRRAFGNVGSLKEETRDSWGFRLLETLWQDVRFGSRMLVKNPGFTAVAVITLALGIGANTAVFSVVDAVLLRPLPYPAADRLVTIVRHFPSGEMPAHDGATFAFLREHYRALKGLAAFGLSSGLNLVIDDRAEYVRKQPVSARYFEVLRVAPGYGRSFSREEDMPGGPLGVVLSHALWKRLFQGDPTVIGQPVKLGGRLHRVVGVMPPHFQSTIPPVDAWTALQANSQGGGLNYGLVGRLRLDLTVAQAQSELGALSAALRELNEQSRLVDAFRLTRYKSIWVANTRPALLVLLGAVGMVLLIACANTACMLLARASNRRREIALRSALGGGRWRIVRQLLTESILLSLLGASLGLIGAQWGVEGLLKLSPTEYPLWQEVAVDARILGTTLVVAVLTGVLFGLAPVLQCTRLHLREALYEGAPQPGAGRHSSRLHRVLVISEVALCVVLLVGAGLLIRTFAELRSVELGFDPRHVLTAQMSLQGTDYEQPEKVATFYEQALARIRQLPGVEAAAVANNLPVERGLNLPIRTPGTLGEGDLISIDWRYMTPEYFQVMRTRLLQGRYLEDTDATEAPAVALVNQEFVRRFFPDQSALGKLIEMAPGIEDRPRQIVGVLGDVKTRGLGEPPRPTMYVPVRQMPQLLAQISHGFFQVTWVVRTRARGGGLIPAMEEVVRSVDPGQPFSGFRTMEQVIATSLNAQRFQMVLLGTFAGLALVMAAAGIYGLISYSVSQRTREIGIRQALGAERVGVLKMVMRQGLVLALVGVGLGVAGGLALTRLLSSQLYGVTATDPLTFGVVSLVLVLVALAACYIPARRAARVDPMVALRHE